MADKNKQGEYYSRPAKLGKWEGFKQFLWNSETSELLGRTGGSWGKWQNFDRKKKVCSLFQISEKSFDESYVTLWSEEKNMEDFFSLSLSLAFFSFSLCSFGSDSH